MANGRLLIGRRDILAWLGVGLLSGRKLAAQGEKLEFTALDHIEFYVSNVEKSRDFFVQLFGNTLLKNRTGKRYLKLGSTYMAFEPPRGSDGQIQVDHFSLAIKRLDMVKLHGFLEQRGIGYRDYPSGRDTAVMDPDGIRTQLSPEDGWSILVPPNFMPETVDVHQEPVFRPTGLEHVLLNVADPEKSAGFYQKFLGPPTQRSNNRIWFQAGSSRLGLLQAQAGQRTGVNHFCVSAEPFDYDVAIRRLREIGVKVEAPEVAGAAEFRDPDGSVIQVMGRRA
jgi:catechol 2,3-dioxygenase-like lactoylglutathione lyase family enzyme